MWALLYSSTGEGLRAAPARCSMPHLPRYCVDAQLRSNQAGTSYRANPRVPPPPQRGPECFGFIQIIKRYFPLQAPGVSFFFWSSADMPANGSVSWGAIEQQPSLSRACCRVAAADLSNAVSWHLPRRHSQSVSVQEIIMNSLIPRQANVRSEAPATNRPLSHIKICCTCMIRSEGPSNGTCTGPEPGNIVEGPLFGS